MARGRALSGDGQNEAENGIRNTTLVRKVFLLGSNQMPLHDLQGKMVLELSGSAYEMGREHGRLLKDLVHVAVHDYLRKSLQIFEVPYEYVLKKARFCERFIPEPYIEEMRGIADGSGISYEEVLSLNCLIDIDNVYSYNYIQCCSFVLHPCALRGAATIHGRNLDFPHHGVIPKTAVVIVRTPDDTSLLPTCAITWAGFVGMLTGSNSALLTASEVSSPADDNSLEGVPIAFLMRRLLEVSDSLEGCAEFLKAAPRTCGYNLAVCDGKTDESKCFEITHKTLKTRRGRKGALVVDTVRLCNHRDVSMLTWPGGAFHHARLVQLIGDNYGQIDIEKAREFLQDRFDPALGREGGNLFHRLCNEHTVQSVLFLPTENRFLVSHGTVPSPNGDYTEILPAKFWDSSRVLANCEL